MGDTKHKILLLDEYDAERPIVVLSVAGELEPGLSSHIELVGRYASLDQAITAASARTLSGWGGRVVIVRVCQSFTLGKL